MPFRELSLNADLASTTSNSQGVRNSMPSALHSLLTYSELQGVRNTIPWAFNLILTSFGPLRTLSMCVFPVHELFNWILIHFRSLWTARSCVMPFPKLFIECWPFFNPFELLARALCHSMSFHLMLTFFMTLNSQRVRDAIWWAFLSILTLFNPSARALWYYMGFLIRCWRRFDHFEHSACTSSHSMIPHWARFDYFYSQRVRYAIPWVFHLTVTSFLTTLNSQIVRNTIPWALYLIMTSFGPLWTLSDRA